MSVSTTHAHYAHYAPTWRALRDAYAGSGAVKRAGIRYLPRPAGLKTEAQYASYLARAVWYGATERVTHALTGAIFRRPLQHTAPASLTAELEDVTQTGVPLRTFAEQAVRETLLMGRFGVLVDFPAPKVSPSGEEIPPPPTSRPYWVAYPTEEIINWRTMQRQGDTVLSLVVLKECVPHPVGLWGTEDFFVVEEQIQYRVLRLNEQGVYHISLWEEIAQTQTGHGPMAVLRSQWIPTRLGVPLDFIPFLFLAPFSLEPAIEKSLLEALVEVNFQYYRHSADYEHALHKTASPTLYICSTLAEPERDLAMGGDFALWINDSTATVGMVEFHGQGLQSHEHAMDSDIANMAALGGRLLESAPLVQETATAVLARTAGSESPMQSLALTVSHGLTQALQLHCWWAGVTDNPDDTAIHLTLNTDLIAKPINPQFLTALMQMVLNQTISKRMYYYNLERYELTRPMVPFDEEAEDLALDAMGEPLALPLVPRGTNGTTAAAD